MRKKILVIGNSLKEYCLVKKLNEEYEVYVSPGNETIAEISTCVDIREDSVSELLDFVMETGIDMTIPVSEKALSSNIVEVFSRNNQLIFAPTKEVTKIISDKALIKKILYKLRIPTPKFGIFEKSNMAMDYIKNLKNPFVIKTNSSSSATIFTEARTAKTIVDGLFSEKNQKVIIEDYVWGTPFAFYIITDGYKALPIGSSLLYKHSLDGEGGQLTSGMGACVPNYKLSIENEYFIMDSVVYPVLEYLESNGNPYVGILGINGILTDNGNIQILGFDSFMQNSDCEAVLSLIDTELYKLFESCIIGSFSDIVDYIPQKDLSATTIVFTCKNKENKENIIYGLDNLDEETKISFNPTVKKNRYLELEAENGTVLSLTTIARTIRIIKCSIF